jgi:hypothetical protein
MPIYHTELSFLQRGFLFGLSACLGSYAALLLSGWIEKRAELAGSSYDANVLANSKDKQSKSTTSTSSLSLSSINTGTVQTVLHHICVLGLILLYAFVNEHTEFIPKIDKHYDIDYFWFLFGLLLLAAVLTIKPSRGESDVLNRDQTEEWKGWMQFLFLRTIVYNMSGFTGYCFFFLPIFFSLDNSTFYFVVVKKQFSLSSSTCNGSVQFDTYFRVCICLVTFYFYISVLLWFNCCQQPHKKPNSKRMTGFGNFSFFYLKADYSLRRFLQMMVNYFEISNL